MKLVTFETPVGARHIGALAEDRTALVDFTASDSAPYFLDMLALIDGGERSLDHARGLMDSARAAIVPGGKNTIAVHCHQTTGGQFIDVGIVAAK